MQEKTLEEKLTILSHLTDEQLRSIVRRNPHYKNVRRASRARLISLAVYILPYTEFYR